MWRSCFFASLIVGFHQDGFKQLTWQALAGSPPSRKHGGWGNSTICPGWRQWRRQWQQANVCGARALQTQPRLPKTMYIEYAIWNSPTSALSSIMFNRPKFNRRPTFSEFPPVFFTSLDPWLKSSGFPSMSVTAPPASVKMRCPAGPRSFYKHTRSGKRQETAGK